MTLLQILLILRARFKIALLIFVLTVAGGVTFGMLKPKLYMTSTSLVFDVKQRDPVAGMLLPVMPGYMATQIEIIKSNPVAQRVVKLLRLDENPALQSQWRNATGGIGKPEAWIGELLQRGLQVTPESGSNIINIGFQAADPTFATVVANAYAQAYIDANIELRVDPARQYARWFGEQGKTLRENLEKAQAKLSEFQQKKGIVARTEELDAEMAKLSDLTSRLTVIQQQTAEAASKQNSGADTLPEIMQNPVLVNLRSNILSQEAKLREIAGNVGKGHPQYQLMESEIAALKQTLELETRRVASSFSTNRTVSKNREADLRTDIAAQKKKLLQLRNERDQLAVLQRDVDAAQNAYAAVTARYNQTSLESQITQTNVSVLNPAVEPNEPSSPNTKKIIAMSLLLGILLGGGMVFLLEMIDRRVRSADDLAEMLQLPVLAVIERPRKPSLLSWRRPPALEFK